jgi:hypothetical protein
VERRDVTTIAYKRVPHPHIEAHREQGPVRIADQLPRDSPYARFNAWLAVKITNGVGTMTCAYIFAIIALISLPAALQSGQLIVIISWIAQTFLQLVLLSIIIVGQNIAAAASDKRAEDTYQDADATLHEAEEIQKHLEAQDTALGDLTEKMLKLTEQMTMLVASTAKRGAAS